MTQKLKELQEAKAIFERRLADESLPSEQREAFKVPLQNVLKEIADIEKAAKSSTSAAPTPPSVEKPKKEGKKAEKREMTDDEKAAFNARMKAGKAAKKEGDAPKPTESKPTSTAKTLTYTGVGRHIGTAGIPCNFDIFINDTGKIVKVPNINGDMEAKDGDFILYLPDGNSFTVVKKSSFAKRCIMVEYAKGVEPIKAEVKAEPKSEPKVEAKIEPKADEKPHKAVVAVVEKIKEKGVEVKKLLSDTKNTPVDAWLQGMIINYNSNKTNEWVERVYVDNESGDLYAKIVYKRGMDWFKLPKYVKICPDSTCETEVDKKEVEGKIAPAKFGMDALKAAYHSPADVQGCRGLAKEIYAIRIEKGDATDKYKKYMERCRNTRWKDEYKAFIEWMHNQAQEIKKSRVNMTYNEALKQVRKEFYIANKV